jgi:hypothetical protein
MSLADLGFRYCKCFPWYCALIIMWPALWHFRFADTDAVDKVIEVDLEMIVPL